MKKLLYTDSRVRLIAKGAETIAANMKFELNRTYMDYHNHVCPACRVAFKVDKHSNEVKKIGAISIGVFTDEKLVIPYVVCKPCSKKPPFQQKILFEAAEDYILTLL